MIVSPPRPGPIYLPPPKTPRSKGVHVSSIIRCIATEARILKPEWAEELSLVDVRTITDRVALLRINIGLAWEEHYIPMLDGVIDHPGEMEVQGVYMTHDGESVDTLVLQPDAEINGQLVYMCHEVKATYKSTKTVGDLSSQWMWMAQMKAYCKGLGTRFARLHALFLNGDYQYPLSPQLLLYDIEFAQSEIDDNWELLFTYMQHRLAVEAEERSGQIKELL